MHFLPVRSYGQIATWGPDISERNLLPDSTGGIMRMLLGNPRRKSEPPLPRLLKGNPRTVIVHILYLEPQPMVQEARELTAGFYLQDYRQ